MREHGASEGYEAPTLQELGTVEDYTHQTGVSVVGGVVEFPPMRSVGGAVADVAGDTVGGVGELPVTGAAVPIAAAAGALAAGLAAARSARRSDGSSTPRR